MKRSKKKVRKTKPTHVMANATSVVITFDDGTTQTVTAVTPPVQPTDTEVDIVLSDGTTKTFVPKA